MSSLADMHALLAGTAAGLVVHFIDPDRYGEYAEIVIRNNPTACMQLPCGLEVRRGVKLAVTLIPGNITCEGCKAAGTVDILQGR